MTSEKVYKTLDLFSGIGGIRMGFERAGFETVFGNDFDPYCKVTYNSNFKSVPLTVGDISKIKSDELPKFDVLLAGFPCQSFSIAGYRKGFLDTGRGDLFFEILRILRDKKPKAFLLENVKNLQSHDKGKTYKIIYQALYDLGYRMKTSILNSMEYGNVPQNRERIFIAGFKSKKSEAFFKFPQKVPLIKKISDILEIDVDQKYYYSENHPYYQKLINTMTKGKVYQWRRVYIRENKSGVCPTLTANMGTGGHNVPLIMDKYGIRKLTPRECARLQGFPDSYVLPKTIPDSKLYKQIGNSVTVSVVEAVAVELKKAIQLNSNVSRPPVRRAS